MVRFGGAPRAVIAVLAVGSVAAVAGVACTLLVPLDAVQCSSASDCASRGAEFAGSACVNHVCIAADAAAGDAGSAEAGLPSNWACLNQTPTASDPSQSVDVQFILFNSFQPYTLGDAVEGGNDLSIVQYAPLVGASIEACSASDPFCVAAAGPVVTTDDAGIAHLTEPGSFDGLYYVQDTSELPSLFYPGRLLAGQSTLTLPTSLIPRSEIAVLGMGLGINANEDPDAGLGYAFVTVHDCDERNASGVSFILENAEAGAQLYLVNGLPNSRATQTDSEGTGGFINIPQGNVSISAVLATNGNRPLQTINVFVRSATMTLVLVRPLVR